jgi:hypothetical protein
VLAAIRFDDKLGLDAKEVSDVRPERHLALEFVTVQSPVSKRKPEHKFRISRITSELARSFCESDFHAADPLILSFSPRGEGTLELTSAL